MWNLGREILPAAVCVAPQGHAYKQISTVGQCMREGGKHVTQLKKGGGRGGRQGDRSQGRSLCGRSAPHGGETPSRRGAPLTQGRPGLAPVLPLIVCPVAPPSLSYIPSSQGISLSSSPPCPASSAEVASSAQARLVATPTLRRAAVSAATVSRGNPPQCKARGSSPTTG